MGEEIELEHDEVDEGDGNCDPCPNLIQEATLEVCSAVLFPGGVIMLLVFWELRWNLLLLGVELFAANVRGPIVEGC